MVLKVWPALLAFSQKGVVRSHWRRSGGWYGGQMGGRVCPHACMQVLIIMCSFDDHHFVSRSSSCDHAREVSVRALFLVQHPKKIESILWNLNWGYLGISKRTSARLENQRPSPVSLNARKTSQCSLKIAKFTLFTVYQNTTKKVCFKICATGTSSAIRPKVKM